MNYELITDNNISLIKKTDIDGKIWWIPMEESNSDYQAYLRWLNSEEENNI